LNILDIPRYPLSYSFVETGGRLPLFSAPQEAGA